MEVMQVVDSALLETASEEASQRIRDPAAWPADTTPHLVSEIPKPVSVAAGCHPGSLRRPVMAQ